MKEIKKKKGKRRWTRDDTDLTLISLPTFIWFVLFSYLPMFGIIIAFKDYKLSLGHGFIYNLLHSDWVGWSNFTYFFKSNAFWMLLKIRSFTILCLLHWSGRCSRICADAEQFAE